MDYTSLLSTVETALNRSDLSSLMDGFIEKVEQEANSFLARNPVRPMITSVTEASVTLQEVDLPADFIDMIELTASDGTDTWPLARLMPGQQFEYYFNRALAPGVSYDAAKAQQYRVLGETLVLSRVPETALSLVIDYYAKLLPISDSNATNWLMDHHADVYEFGVLAHAGKHLRDYDFYDRNRELYLGALEQVAQSYPQRSRDVALVDTGAPWASSYTPGIYV